MDVRSAAAAFVFIVLSLSLGYLKVQAAGDCLMVDSPVIITPSTSEHTLSCFIGGGPPTWTKRSNLCDGGAYSNYTDCDGSYFCTVPGSELLGQRPTYFCCGAQEEFCYEIIINPIVRHSVPPVVRAGREETAYSIVTAKPRPTVLPLLTIDFFCSNEVNRSMINASTQIVDDHSNTTQYVVIHTFTVPEEVDELATVQFRFELPDDTRTWTAEGEFLFDQITILPAVTPVPPTISTTTGTAATDNLESPTTTPAAKPTSDKSTYATGSEPGTDGFTAGPTCLGAGHVAAAAVGTAGAIFIIIMGVVALCTVLWWYKKRRHSSVEGANFSKNRTKEPHYHKTNGFSASQPTSLPLQNHNVIKQNSITPTPTPLSDHEEAKLLRSSSGGRATASSPLITGNTNLGYGRLPSRDSTSPSTPGEIVRPLSMSSSSSERSAIAATLPDIRTESLGTSLGLNSSMESGSSNSDHDAVAASVQVNSEQQGLNEASTDGQDRHIYEEIKKQGGSRYTQRPLPDTPGSKQNTHPAAHNLNGFQPQIFLLPEQLLNLLPHLQIANQENSLQSHAPSAADASLEEPSDDTYSKEGDKVILPPHGQQDESSNV